MTEQEIYEAAIQKWGVNAQMGMAMAEAGELIAALGRFSVQNRNNYEEVIGELADVEIMLEQMRHIFSPVLIDDMKKKKLDRLADRLK